MAIPFRGRDRRIGHELVDDTTNSTPTYSQTRRRGWRGRNSAIGIDEGRRNCLSFPLHSKHTRHPVGPSRRGRSHLPYSLTSEDTPTSSRVPAHSGRPSCGQPISTSTPFRCFGRRVSAPFLTQNSRMRSLSEADGTFRD